MTDAFLRACRDLMPIEGGWENDPTDAGGETYRGLSRRHNPDLPLWRLVDQYKGRGLTGAKLTAALDQDPDVQATVQAVYYARYWTPNQLDQVSAVPLCEPVAAEMFDTGVNQGVGTAARYLQRALNALNRDGKLYPDLGEDGVIGRKTIGALTTLSRGGAHEIDSLLTIMNVMQGADYLAIMRAHGDQEKYCRGWFSRVRITKAPS